MANIINTIFGFDFSKNSVTNVVDATVRIKDSIISIGPIFKEFQSHVDKMSHVTYWTGIATSAEKAFGGLKSVVSSVSVGLKNIFEFADEYAEKGDKIAKTSRMLGLSVKDYQAFSSAAIDAGMSVEEMDSALKKFSVNLAKARGGDKTMLHNFSKAIFGTDGDLKSLNGLKTTNDVLIALADSYSKYSTAEKKAFVSSELFGKSGLKMSEILSQGGQSLKDFLNSYEGGFSKEGAEKAEEFTHELQMMREEFEKIKIEVAQELFPAFKELFGEILSMLRGEKGSELKNVLKETGVSFKNFVLAILPKIPRILESVVKIVDYLTPKLVAEIGLVISVVPILVKIIVSLVAMWPLLKSFLSLGMSILGVVKAIAFGALGAAILKIGLIIAGVLSVYKIFTEIHENWRMFSDYIEEKLENATGIMYTLLAGLRSIVGQFEMTYRLVGLIFGDWESWSEFVQKDLANVNGIVNFIGDCLAGVMYGLYEAFNWVSEKLEYIGGFLSKIPFIKELFGGTIDFGNSGDIGSDFLNGQSSLGQSVAQAVMESNTTTTNRFSVDFKNMPRGVQVTAPDHGDFDYSRGYVLAGM